MSLNKSNHCKCASTAVEAAGVYLSREGVTGNADLMGLLVCDHLAFCPFHLPAQTFH